MVSSLIVGGMGFIGSHLVEELVRRGRDVTIVDDLSNGRLENLNWGNASPTWHHTTFLQHDITHGISELRGLRFDEIYYLVCHPRSISFANPIRDCEVNLLGLISCMELAWMMGAKLLFTSNTGIVSNPPTLPVNETFAPNPLTPYDINKLASERILRAYYEPYGVRSVTVRFAAIYGPRQQVNERLDWRPVIPEFTTKLLHGEAPTIDGDGSQTRDLLYVEDAVDGTIRAMESSAAEANNGGVFILGTNRETSINRLFDLIASRLNSTIRPIYGPAKKGDIMRMRYDYGKAEDTFGFRPRIPIEDGLDRTIEYLRHHT